MQKSFFSKLLGLMILGVAMMPSSKVFAFGFPTLDIEAVCNGIDAQLNQIQSKLTMIQETMSIDNIKQVLGDKFAGLAKLKDVQKIKAKLEEKKKRLEERKKRLEALKKKYEEAKKWINEKKEKVEETVEHGKKVYNQGKEIYDQAYKEGKKLYEEGKQIYDKGKDVYDKGKEYYEQGKQLYAEGQQILASEKQTADKDQLLYNESQQANAAGQSSYGDGKQIYDTGKSVYDNGKEVYQSSSKIIEVATKTDWNNPKSVMENIAIMQQETVHLGNNLSGMEKDLNTLDTKFLNTISGDTVETTEKTTMFSNEQKTYFDSDGKILKKDEIQTNQTLRRPFAAEQENQSVLKNTTNKDTKNQILSDKKSDTKSNIKSKIGTDTKMITPSILNSKTPSAFKKTSENTLNLDVFAAHYVSMGHAAAVGESFKTGTDEDGNFYFADGLANWCQINYDDRISEDTFEKCFNTICGELNAEVEEDRNEAKKKYQNVLAETIPSIFNKANAIKNKAGSSTVDGDMDDLKLKAGDSTRANIAIEIENASIDLDAARDQLQLALGDLELSILNDKYMSYCEDQKNAEAAESSWTPDGPSGTDDNGLFYFSDELASWCDLDISKGVKAEDVELCICTICEDINDPEEAQRQHNLRRYAKVRGETLAGTYVNLIRFKKEVASFEIDDRVDEIKNNSNDNQQAQMSGLAEMVAQENRFLQYQNLVTDAKAALTVVFDTIPFYCEAGPVGWEKLPEKDGKTAKERCQKYVRKLK